MDFAGIRKSLHQVDKIRYRPALLAKIARGYSKPSDSCIAAVDSEYIRDYMDYASNYDSIPYPVTENPKYARDEKLREA